MSQTIYTNPFLTLAELLRSLRMQFLTEAGLMVDASKMTPQLGEVLGALAGLINECEAIRKLIDDLQRTDVEAYEAFHRALEKA